MAKLVWEKLDSKIEGLPSFVGGVQICRAKVPGGWLISAGQGTTFYPDPQHQWDGSSLP